MLVFAAAALAISWITQSSSTNAGLRGLDAVSSQVVWASGTHGIYIVTKDGGKHWNVAVVPGAEALDFRDIKAFDQHTAFLLSSGPGDQSRIYKTSDAGRHWRLLFTNPDVKGFWDAIAFWDPRHRVLLGDPVDGHFAIFTTDDGGEHWTRRNSPQFCRMRVHLQRVGPASWHSVEKHGSAREERALGVSFAAATKALPGRSPNTPLKGTSVSSGIFSLAFRDDLQGVAVGGDYQHPEATSGAVDLTDDGGRTWRKANTELGGYRSGVSFVSEKKLVAVGTSGCDVSTDGGQTWRTFSQLPLNAVASFTNSVWGAGPKGRIVKLESRSGRF